MLKDGLTSLKGQHILLLQGPIGSFFWRFARDLEAVGAIVHKINFNAGDWLFYRKNAITYRDTMANWPLWFEHYLEQNHIDVMFLFGDCRPVHLMAHWIAAGRGVSVGVFEEGYVRPSYITLEYSGVNGYSLISRNPEHYPVIQEPLPEAHTVGSAFWNMVWYGFCYFGVGALGKPWFPHYVHHRPLTLREGVPWIRSAWRKWWYRWTERGMEERLAGPLDKRFFLVPLQVHNDSQIRVHAHWDSMEQFMEAMVDSFAREAPADTCLVFKHHPMDRGYRNFKHMLQKLAQDHGLGERIIYIHDQHLPTLLKHARGVVVVNSTVGLSALWHKAPTKVCGSAVYDIPGLTWQGPLDDFWKAAPEHVHNRDVHDRFRDYLIRRTQVNGSFYKRIPSAGNATGVYWESPK